MHAIVADAANKFAAPFEDMSQRIRRNLEAEFAGAILIVAPDGEKIEVLLTDPSKDAEAFWAVANSKIQIATAKYQQDQQRLGGFGRR